MNIIYEFFPTALVAAIATFVSLFTPFIKTKIEKLTDDYLNLKFNKKLENHKSQLQKENDKYRKELEESLEVIRKEHSQDLVNYNLFTNQIFIVYPKIYGLIQKSLKDVALFNFIYYIPDTTKIENEEDLEELLLQLEVPDKHIRKLKVSFEKNKYTFQNEFMEFYNDLKKMKSIERNEITLSYYLENKIYFSQEMINLVESFYLNLSKHLNNINTNLSKDFEKYQKTFLLTNNKIVKQINSELQKKST